MDDAVRRSEFTLKVRELERRLKKIEVNQRGVNYDNLERGLCIALKAVKGLLSLGSEGARIHSGLIKEIDGILGSMRQSTRKPIPE